MLNQDFIVTFSKQRFSPLQAKEKDIKILDIAHALSLMCRANGHIRRFYSVAQHCVNCCKEAEARGLTEELQLACLLHDASEAFISDITRPVKRSLPQYLVVEEALQRQIFVRFRLAGLDEAAFGQVKEIDDTLLYYEMLDLMGEAVVEQKSLMVSTPDLSQRDFAAVEAEFLAEFNRLYRDEE